MLQAASCKSAAEIRNRKPSVNAEQCSGMNDKKIAIRYNIIFELYRMRSELRKQKFGAKQKSNLKLETVTCS